MVLADTSVWIEHLRRSQTEFVERLSEGLVLIHPFVAGELACGSLRNRDTFLSELNSLPQAEIATETEVLGLIRDRKLWGRGLGWIDVHLLASAMLTHCRLWTLDKRLGEVAADLGLT